VGGGHLGDGGRRRTRNITVEILDGSPVEDQQVELVERKGVGHPDSKCDAILEKVSVALRAECMATLGQIGRAIGKPLIASAQLALEQAEA
jgi:S-adenosylmethionine synthetase